MADRVRATDFTRGPACPLCGRAYLPGHNAKERQLLQRNEYFREQMIAALGVIIGGDR
jgi:hypothetical protein